MWHFSAFQHFDLSLFAVDACTCECDGNYYSTLGSNHCYTFTQRTAFLPAETLACPLGTSFDVYECTCNHKADTYCAAQCPGVKGKSHYNQGAGMHTLIEIILTINCSRRENLNYDNVQTYHSIMRSEPNFHQRRLMNCLILINVV